MTEEQKELERQKIAAEQFVHTTKNKAVKIEMVGFDKAYQDRADVNTSCDISLLSANISDVGAPGDISKLIPGTMNLYLDKNKLYSWDQYFQIIKQLPWLRVITLTGNKFRRIAPDYLEGKDKAYLTHTMLSEVIFIDMGLDWEQICALAPVLCYVE